jgi:hypothetical protein
MLPVYEKQKLFRVRQTLGDLLQMGTLDGRIFDSLIKPVRTIAAAVLATVATTQKETARQCTVGIKGVVHFS